MCRVRNGVVYLRRFEPLHFLGISDMANATRVKESARGKSLSYSGDLRKLLDKFIKDRVVTIPKDSSNPAEEIRDELTTFRFDYADLDLIHRLLISNPAIGYTHINEIFENKGQIPEHISLMNLASTAIDRILMKEAQRWWKQNRVEEKAASVESSWYKFLGIVPFYIAKEAATYSDVDLPYKGEQLFRETLGYLQLLQPVAKKNPKKKIDALIEQYSPNLESVGLSDLIIMFQETPTLVSRSVGDHTKRFWNGTIYDVLQGALEDAVSVNAKKLVQLEQEGKLPKLQKGVPSAIPSDRDDIETETKKHTREDSPTKEVQEDEQATQPGGPKAKKLVSSVASVVEYKGHLYVRQ